MGLLHSVSEALRASTQSANRGDETVSDSEGAFWCHDCRERIRDVDVEGPEPPSCPTCGDEMEFERSAASTGCAC